MAKGGARPGAGKPKGKWDRATLEAELAAAQNQLVELSKKRQAGRKLAVEVLDDIMHLSMGLAAKHQPLSGGELAGPGREPDEAKFDKYLSMTGEFAGRLANFQSPKFKSTTISVETIGGVPADAVAGGGAPLRKLSAQDAYRMLRDSSDLIDLTPTVVTEKVQPPAKKAVGGKR